MPHIHYIESTLYKTKEEEIFLKEIYSFIADYDYGWDRGVEVYYRDKKNKRIYLLELKNKKGGLSFSLKRVDINNLTNLSSNSYNTFMSEDFFNNKSLFIPILKSEVIGIFFYEKENQIKINKKIKINEKIDWSKNEDITSINHLKLLSLIRSYKETGKEKYYKDILKVFGEKNENK